MRKTEDCMGMPITVELPNAPHVEAAMEQVFAYFRSVDERFSTYKTNSEISRINRAELHPSGYSNEMTAILRLAQETKELTRGYFDIRTPKGLLDPSGIVKGWAINNAAELLVSLGHRDFYVEAGGDIQVAGHNSAGTEWRIGIRNPFARNEIVKVVYPRGKGIATSGTAERGAHIYDPFTGSSVRSDLKSLTVLGPDVYEADRFATAAFAMGAGAVPFIESLDGFEGYAIDASAMATMTSGFTAFL